MMDSLKINDHGLESKLNEQLDSTFDENKFSMYAENMPFQKLSYKFSEFKEEIDNKQTFYGYIKNHYLNVENKNES